MAFFTETVHVDFVSEQVSDGRDIGSKAGDAQIDGGAVGEDFGVVVGDRKTLQAEAQVAGDGDTVFANHSNASAAIDVEG